MNIQVPNGILLEEYSKYNIKKGFKKGIDAICIKTGLRVTLILDGDNFTFMKCDALSDVGFCNSPNGPVNEEGKKICDIEIKK